MNPHLFPHGCLPFCLIPLHHGRPHADVPNRNVQVGQNVPQIQRSSKCEHDFFKFIIHRDEAQRVLILVRNHAVKLVA